MATAAKFVQPIPIFFGLSRSTRCGCCSYQVSSISVKLLVCWKFQNGWRYHGNRGIKIMGCGDVRYCFAMAILVFSDLTYLS
jgi:hypothetical protein